MIYRRLGETSLSLSVLGYGCWGVGGGTKEYPAYGKIDPNKIVVAIEKAIEVGINFFDTSALYGAGQSEVFLSKVLPKHRKKIYIATKAGLLDVEKKCFSLEQIRKSLENSLKRLNTDYIDLFQLHNFDKEDLINYPDILNLLLTLKKEGKIIEWGISFKTPNHALDLLKKIKIPSIQCNFNILDTRCIDNKLFQFCKDNKIGVIARTPLAFGFLSLKIDAKKSFPDNDHRSKWSIESKKNWVENSKKLKKLLSARQSINMAQLCIKFCITPEVVSTCIPGMHSVEEVLENYEAVKSGPLSDDIYSDICNYNKYEVLK